MMLIGMDPTALWKCPVPGLCLRYHDCLVVQIIAKRKNRQREIQEETWLSIEKEW